MERVAVSKNTIVGLVVALVAAIVAIAFLLGRQSVQPMAAAPIALKPAEVAPPASAPPPTAPAPLPSAPAPLPSAPGPAPSVGGDAAVAAYFKQMDAIQVEAGVLDAKEYANQLITRGMSGDASGFELLLSQLEHAEMSAKSIVPPTPCNSYHQSLLVLLGESKTILRGLERAFVAKDTSAIATVAGNASQMQARTLALQDEEKRLKTDYRVP